MPRNQHSLWWFQRIWTCFYDLLRITHRNTHTDTHTHSQRSINELLYKALDNTLTTATTTENFIFSEVDFDHNLPFFFLCLPHMIYSTRAFHHFYLSISKMVILCSQPMNDMLARKAIYASLTFGVCVCVYARCTTNSTLIIALEHSFSYMHISSLLLRLFFSQHISPSFPVFIWWCWLYFGYLLLALEILFV